METRSAKRKKMAQIIENDAKAAIDRISDLPDEVIHHILFLLPIKCVAQLSVLSKRWRILWSTFPDLDFRTLNSFEISSKNVKFLEFEKARQPLHSTRMDFITQVLSIRDKHSDIRVLCFRARLSFSRLNGLIRRAIRHNVRELDIEAATVCTDDYFNFPRCVIGSESLRVLKLKSGFRLPPSSVMRHGFQYLQTLSLSLVILNNQPSLPDLFSESSFPLLKTLNLDACFGLKYLHVGCRVLQDLNLEKCYELEGLDISCAKLQRMRLAKCFDAYSDKSWVKVNAPKLEHLCWQHNAVTDLTIFEHSNLLHEVTLGFFILTRDNTLKLQSAVDFLSGLSHAHSLYLERQTIEIYNLHSLWLQILSNNHLLFQPFYNLKYLELHTGFNKGNVSGLTCLFKSSPTLNTLIVKIIHEYRIERKEWNRDLWDMTITEGEQYWESQIRTLESFLQHLKVVKIHGFHDYENEVALAKFLLKHGKALEQMVLYTGNCNARDTLRRQKIRSQMMGFSWASSNAKVAFQ
ncbi:putative F-box/FBD/LRR-repeat protein, partial [Mucuna pruriens]